MSASPLAMHPRPISPPMQQALGLVERRPPSPQYLPDADIGSRSWRSILLSPSPSPEKTAPRRDSMMSRQESDESRRNSDETVVVDKAHSPHERTPYSPGRSPYDTIVRRGSLPLFFRETPRLPRLETGSDRSTTPLREIADLKAGPGSSPDSLDRDHDHDRHNDRCRSPRSVLGPRHSHGPSASPAPPRLTLSPPQGAHAYPRQTASSFYPTPVSVSERQPQPRWADYSSYSPASRRSPPRDLPLGPGGSAALSPFAPHLQPMQQPLPPSHARARAPTMPSYLPPGQRGALRPRLSIHPYAAPAPGREFQRFHSAGGFEPRPAIRDRVTLSPASAISPGGYKAPRKRADDTQLAILNEVFERTSYPSTAEREDLARRLGMTSRSVQIWFQNRRRAVKVEAISAMQRAEAEARHKEPPMMGCPAPPPYMYDHLEPTRPTPALSMTEGAFVKRERLSPNSSERLHPHL